MVDWAEKYFIEISIFVIVFGINVDYKRKKRIKKIVIHFKIIFSHISKYLHMIYPFF